MFYDRKRERKARFGFIFGVKVQIRSYNRVTFYVNDHIILVFLYP